MNKLLFLDIETTSLDERNGRILEVAAIVTNNSLEETAVFHHVVKVNAGQLQACFMDAKVIDMHTRSRLFADVEVAPKTLFEIEGELVTFLQQHFPNQKPPLWGNSVHFDLRWLTYHMPRVAKLLHYQIRDVSGFLGILAEAKSVEVPRIKAPHRALPDCRLSIALLKSALEHVA